MFVFFEVDFFITGSSTVYVAVLIGFFGCTFFVCVGGGIFICLEDTVALFTFLSSFFSTFFLIFAREEVVFVEALLPSFPFPFTLEIS